uniref:C-type lectin domain-containing protein n=1 Tax=Otolemur garnettii TaxID=30611 RepID=H0WSV8_OTOGA
TDAMLPPRALSSLAWMLLSCLMLMSQVQGEDPQNKTASTRVSCPWGAKPYASHCYALFMSQKKWMDANKACQNQPSGQLVSVLNKEEGSFVSLLVRSTVTSFSHIWIGLHDPTEGALPKWDGWEWSTSEKLQYVAWEKPPSNTSHAEYCGSLSRNTGFLMWKAYNCNVSLPYVCKFKE